METKVLGSSPQIFRNRKVRPIHLIIVVLILLLVAACSASKPDPGLVATSPFEPVDLEPPRVSVTRAATTTQAQPTPSAVWAPLDDLGPAPELTNQVWLNIDRPLRLAELRGRVVLLEMWTFG